MTSIEQLERFGIRRVGNSKSAFRYRYPDGRSVPGDELRRIRALAVPPAWTNVRINPSPAGKLQALGRDARGRWQYRYHPGFRSQRERAKYARVLRFAHALPRMRRRIAEDLRRPGLPREKVMACVLRILSCCFIRPGSQVYAHENGSYGLATLRNEHVTVTGNRVRFDFVGKGRKPQHRELEDAQVARIVRQLKKLPGRELFKYVDDDGTVVDVRRRHINGYIKETMGAAFTAKDFRTWAGTLICACALARAGFDPHESPRHRKRKVSAAIRETAEVLGNTPSVCRSSYVYPSVLSSFDRGRVVNRYFQTPLDLARREREICSAERALLSLLESEQRRAAG